MSYPGVAEGGIWVETDSHFRSAGVLFRQGWLFGDSGRLEWLAGYRYLQLQEDLFVDELATSTDPGGFVPAGTVFEIHDEFRVNNEFHGGDIGLQWWSCLHGWNLEVTSKVALGGLTRTADIYGSTLIDVAGGPAFETAGGLLALPTNMGSHESCRFVAVPELNVKLRRQLSRYFDPHLGILRAVRRSSGSRGRRRGSGGEPIPTERRRLDRRSPSRLSAPRFAAVAARPARGP